MRTSMKKKILDCKACGPATYNPPSLGTFFFPLTWAWACYVG